MRRFSKTIFIFLPLAFILGGLFLVKINAQQISSIPDTRSVRDHLTNQIVPRSGWGCPVNDPDSPYYCDGPFWEAFRNPISHIVIHHTATNTTPATWAEEMRYVWTLHATIRDSDPNDGVQGWTDIGYNYLIDPNGTIYEGRYGGEGANGGHITSHNIGTIGISLLGDYETMTVSDPQYQKLKELLKTLLIRYNLDPSEYAYDYGGSLMQRLSMHQNWNNTLCPGTNVVPLVSQLRTELTTEVREYFRENNSASICPDGYLSESASCAVATVQNDWQSSISEPTNAVMDSSGNIYVTSYNNNYLYRISPAGTRTLLSNALLYNYIEESVDLEIDASRNRLYILNDQMEQVIGINLSTLDAVFFADTEEGPRDMVLGSDGTIYVANAVSDSLSIISPTAGVEEVVPLQGEYPIALGITENDTLYIAHYLSDAVTKRTPDGTETYFELPGILPSDIEIDSGNNAYIVNEGTGIISRISTAGEVSVYATLPYQSHNIAFDTDGNLVAVHPYNNAVSKIYGSDYVTTIEDVGEYPLEIFARPEALYVVSKDSDSVEKINISANGLLPLTRPIYRFWSPANSRHFFTMSTPEKREVVSNFENNVWSYENVGFYALNESVDGALAVHRFWSDTYSTHFYTMSEIEKNWIQSTFPESVWRYEGIAYYAHETEVTDTTAVYRFWSPTKNTHFFTTSEVEKNWIQETFDDLTWTFEGIAFYTY